MSPIQKFGFYMAAHIYLKEKAFEWGFLRGQNPSRPSQLGLFSSFWQLFNNPRKLDKWIVEVCDIKQLWNVPLLLFITCGGLWVVYKIYKFIIKNFTALVIQYFVRELRKEVYMSHRK